MQLLPSGFPRRVGSTTKEIARHSLALANLAAVFEVMGPEVADGVAVAERGDVFITHPPTLASAHAGHRASAVMACLWIYIPLGVSVVPIRRTNALIS